MKKKPHALIILDGFGYRQEHNDNAIHHAHTPTLDRLFKTRPHTTVLCSGHAVGLPDGQMGNSEVGHMCLGSGRIIHQNISKIDQSIKDHSFSNNPAYNLAIEQCLANNSSLHLLALLSSGGVHSHERHLWAMLSLAASKGIKKVYIHAILDGRDTPPRSALSSLKSTQSLIESLGVGHIASIIGRFYAMDRDNRWERIENAYKLYTEGSSEYYSDNVEEALQSAYDRDENDEFVSSTSINDNGQVITINDDDSIIFMNFRADRARQLTASFISDSFTGFSRSKRPNLSSFVSTTQYDEQFNIPCAFPPQAIKNSLGEVLSSEHKTQLRIAETEKYAHVTFFFSGGREQVFNGEQRILIPSPDVNTYDLKPEMSAFELTEKLEHAISQGEFDTIICNYANGDMVGHTGNFQAAVKAVEALDQCIARLETAMLNAKGEMLITADHGNCEQMIDYISNQKHTQHTTEPVPLIYIGERQLTLASNGRLCDIAPTLLDLMDIQPPEEMTGNTLIIDSKVT
jgi:2,3-bisphosphoglycerate-independent phosphoglycerate mutase